MQRYYKIKNYLLRKRILLRKDHSARVIQRIFKAYRLSKLKAPANQLETFIHLHDHFMRSLHFASKLQRTWLRYKLRCKEYMKRFNISAKLIQRFYRTFVQRRIFLLLRKKRQAIAIIRYAIRVYLRAKEDRDLYLHQYTALAAVIKIQVKPSVRVSTYFIQIFFSALVEGIQLNQAEVHRNNHNLLNLCSTEE